MKKVIRYYVSRRKFFLAFCMAMFLSFCLAFSLPLVCLADETDKTGQSEAIKEPDQLYSQAAVLMDASSGRVLFSKNGQEILPMASTTKIMTCIVALENGNLDDVVTFSSYAASMPDVQLNAKAGEEFILKDLLYSLMLESHNDTAAAIAEHIGGGARDTREESIESIQQFIALMNQKARDIGCVDTFFITPNGLDAAAPQKQKIHSTTAEDLARIMSYCIEDSPKKEEFLTITGTGNYTFTSKEGRRSYSCTNHNAFLGMMEGALSGKTGFTGKAGYCYVGALKKDGKTLVAALLACGWPNHKTYKWSDTKKLMNYGLDYFKPFCFDTLEIDRERLKEIPVENGKTERIGLKAATRVELLDSNTQENKFHEDDVLLRKDEVVSLEYEIKTQLEAPVEAGETVGSVRYLVNGEIWKVKNVVAADTIDKIDWNWCFKMVLDKYLMLFNDCLI